MNSDTVCSFDYYEKFLYSIKENYGEAIEMFTGIITDIGIIKAVDAADGGKRFVIATSYDADLIDMGASIACNGACMTVAAKEQGCFTIFM